MICCYEMRKGRGSCVEPSSLKNFGSMFGAEAIHAQIPSNIEPNYQRTWCNGHKTGHASFLSSYIANLPLVSPMFVLGLLHSQRELLAIPVLLAVFSRAKRQSTHTPGFRRQQLSREFLVVQSIGRGCHRAARQGWVGQIPQK